MQMYPLLRPVSKGDESSPLATQLQAYPTTGNWHPQGLPLSGTFFVLAINEIVELIPSPIQSLLFVDDFSILLRSSNPQQAYRVL